MAEFPYIQSSDRLKKFLDHIQLAGVPEKFILKSLEAAGFKSTNDRPIIKIMKFIGFLDGSSAPTDSWKKFRDKSQAGNVLASGIKSGYSDLYQTYPNAHQQGDEALRNYFSANTSVGDAALSQIVKTFRTLVDRADFSDSASADVSDRHQSPVENAATTLNPHIVGTQTRNVGGSTVTINVRLEIPPSDDPAVYEAFFQSMKKHLLSD